jgi:transcriptional regulator of acetoin/glycerol metabolism
VKVVKRRPPRIVAAVDGDVAAVRPPDIAPEPSGLPPERAYVQVDVSLASAERAHVERILRVCGGCVSEAARLLGIARTTLRRKLRAWERQDAGGGGAERSTCPVEPSHEVAP